jgi:hypothetical protein
MANTRKPRPDDKPSSTLGFRTHPADLVAMDFLQSQPAWQGQTKGDILRALLLREAKALGGPVAAPAGTPARQKATSPRIEAVVSEEPTIPPAPDGYEIRWEGAATGRLALVAVLVGASAAGAPPTLAASPALGVEVPTSPVIEGPAPSAAAATSADPLPTPTVPAEPPAAPVPPAAAIEAAAPAQAPHEPAVSDAPSAPTTSPQKAPRKGKGTTSKATGKAPRKPSAASEGAVDAGSVPPMPPKDAVKEQWKRFRAEHPEQKTPHLIKATGVNRKRLNDLKVNETDLRSLWRYLVSQGAAH